jgi:hypothetical protein
METHKIQPPDSSQDGPGAAASRGRPPPRISADILPQLQPMTRLQRIPPRYYAARRDSGSSQQSRCVNILFHFSVVHKGALVAVSCISGMV